MQFLRKLKVRFVVHIFLYDIIIQLLNCQSEVRIFVKFLKKHPKFTLTIKAPLEYIISHFVSNK